MARPSTFHPQHQEETLARYSKDPHTITARYAGKCSKCGAPIQKGEEAYYYPNGKRLLGMKACACGHDARRDFESAAADEAFMCSQF